MARRGERKIRSGAVRTGAIASAAAGATDSAADSPDKKRKILADFCRLVGEQANGRPVSRAQSTDAASAQRAAAVEERLSNLSPRVHQTLLRMLAGDSEKEIGVHLGVSKHTIHVYVKTIYRHFQVSSRGELLAGFVDGAYRSGPKNE